MEKGVVMADRSTAQARKNRDGLRGRRKPTTASATYRRVVDEVTRVGITQAELARAVGTGLRAVQNWAAGNNAPRGETARRLLDVRTVVDLLADSYTDEGIDIWLHARNRNLETRRPIDLIAAGEIDKVTDEAKWVAGGM
jgi:transcriptional regulator with XRE-family HTH domain